MEIFFLIFSGKHILYAVLKKPLIPIQNNTQITLWFLNL